MQIKSYSTSHIIFLFGFSIFPDDIFNRRICGWYILIRRPSIFLFLRFFSNLHDNICSIHTISHLSYLSLQKKYYVFSPIRKHQNKNYQIFKTKNHLLLYQNKSRRNERSDINSTKNIISYYINSPSNSMLILAKNTLQISLKGFASGIRHHTHSAAMQDSSNIVVEKTKYNPDGELDLRGYQNYEALSETSIKYSNIHSKKYQYNSAYAVFSFMPNKIAKFLGSLVEAPKTVIASDTLYLPKISENNVPVYDSIDAGKSFLIANQLLTKYAPFLILAFSPLPTLSIITYCSIYYIYYITNFQLARNLVTKLELSPQTQQVIYQKVSIFGSLVTKSAKINDFEHVTFQKLFGEVSPRERASRGLFNKDVAFRVKSTGELLFFDSQGIWNDEGLNHVLLV